MRYDLIVVGGGMSGIAVGHFFREKNILILDRNELLSGATGNNSGFIVSGFSEHYAATRERLGAALAREALRLNLRSHQRIGELAKNIDCEYSRSGSFCVPRNETERELLIASCKMMRDDGFDVDWIENAETGLREPTGALLNREDGRINSRNFWRMLAAGLPTKTYCQVNAVDARTDGVVLHTTQGRLESEFVVFCLNADSDGLLPELKMAYVRLDGQIISLPLRRPPPTNCPVMMGHGEIYWKFEKDRILFGGLEDCEGSEKQIHQEKIAWIREFMDADLIGSHVPEQTWSGTMALTSDGFPIVGPLARPRCFALAGLCAIGHSYALECASWLWALIAEENNLIPPYCSSERLASMPRFSTGDWQHQFPVWSQQDISSSPFPPRSSDSKTGDNANGDGSLPGM